MESVFRQSKEIRAAVYVQLLTYSVTAISRLQLAGFEQQTHRNFTPEMYM